MSKFKQFMKKDRIDGSAVTELKLKGFDEPIKLRPVTAAEAANISKASISMRPGKKGKQEPSFDSGRYNTLLAVQSMIYPDLKDKELQEFYGAVGEEMLYGKMFLAGEATEITEVISEISGISDLEDDIEEAKN